MPAPTKATILVSETMADLATAVNTYVGVTLPAANRACIDIKLDYKRTRQITLFEAVINEAPVVAGISYPKITSVKVATGTTEAAVKTAIETAMVAQTAPAGYGNVQFISFWKADRPFWMYAALVPVWDNINALSAGSIVAVTGPATHTVTDMDGTILVDASGGVVTVNLPTCVGRMGKEVTVAIINATAAVTIDASGAQTIGGNTTYVMFGEGESVTLVSDGTANWVIKSQGTVPHIAYVTTQGAAAMVPYTAKYTDDVIHCTIHATGAFDIEVSVPAAANCPGKHYYIIQAVHGGGAGKDTIVKAVGIGGGADQTITIAGGFVEIVSSGVEWIILASDLA